MNIVQNKELSFHNTNFAYMEMGGQVWLTAAEVGQALEYADDKAVQRIYSRHADEFTAQMTGVVKLTTPSGKQESRVFSLRGAHLIAMFARTPVAKEFRRWVLDILDREVAHSPISKQFTDDELCRLAWMWDVTNRMQNFARDLYPAMRTIKSEHAGKFYDFGNEFRWTFEEARKAIAKASEHIAYEPQNDDNWSRVLPRLRKELH
ncbi:P22AR C-terminal domain-containing protein [Klebsiella quasipneumoniae]|uniref:P22AR C-terminal domain-containing protein n=1 Tax=Klebsiella quasipneumoniae TaxID=1463165 RepID=UPI003A4D30F0